MQKNENIQILEAIRAGIPSRASVEATTDLRLSLLNKIDKDLVDLESGKSPAGRLIWGEYGQGKTHFLKQVEQHIISSGFAVSYVSLSRDLNLSNLDTLFPALSTHLLTKDSRIPGLLNPLCQSSVPESLLALMPEIAAKISHPLPTLVFKAFAAFEMQNLNLLYNTMMGKKENLVRAKGIIREKDKERFRDMPKFILKEHLISFFEFLPYLLQGMGYKGWVILIDELEIIGKLSKLGRVKAYKNLAWLLNWGTMHKLPIYTLGASVKALQDEVFYGKKTFDAVEMPNFAIERFGESTANILRNFFTMATESRNLLLTPVSKKEVKPLLAQLLEIHTKAIAWKHEVPHSFIDDALKRIDPANKPIRQIVRMMIELMDIYAISGKMPPAFHEKLIDSYDFEEDIISGDEDNEEAGGKAKGFCEKPLNELFDI